MVRIRSLVGQLLKSLHWLPVVQRVQLKIATLTHRALTTGQPAYLSDLLQRWTHLRTTRSTDMDLLDIPDFRIEFVRTFRFAALSIIWNSLSVELIG